MTRPNFDFAARLTPIFMLATSFVLLALPSHAANPPLVSLNGNYEFSLALTCVNKKACFIKSQVAVPTLILTHVRCAIDSTGGADADAPILLALSIDGNGHTTYLVKRNLSQEPAGRTATESSYLIDEELLKLFVFEDPLNILATFGGLSRIAMNCNFIGRSK